MRRLHECWWRRRTLAGSEQDQQWQVTKGHIVSS
jgi:hypothetical protein